MYPLRISDEVKARLKALAQDGRESEDHVLRRLLGCLPPAALAALATPDGNGDFIDTTYGIRFPEGFQIFRTYKGLRYTARVVSGRWVLDGETGAAGRFDSLNQLSQAVIDGNENAWMFWFYQTAEGERERISELRDPALVQRRPRRKRRQETAAAPTPLMTAPISRPGGKPWEPI